MYFSVDKRHWPDLVLLQCFSWIKGTGLSLVLSQSFLWIRGTDLHWYYYNVFMEAFCHVRAEVFFAACDYFGARFIFSVISLFFLLQMLVSDHGWRCLPLSVKPDLGELFRHY